ncbi:unnamed protein product [Lepeophtheirus salmonis]|uniref:(salmon louse) hypothetical protein n=1 Tax=Lepeophtheirus salmonis TaxID=72036 RepID=A0A7R8H5B3_LEPSM|nr:unnamed protein product [Lepeophtheirus salmonis]CAF2878083.1 unnamed protein product [Lepeophtheirus salmonis]
MLGASEHALINNRVFLPNSRPYKMLQLKPVFIVSYKLAKRNKPFSDDEFIKDCISHVANIRCSGQKPKMDSIALSRRIVISEDLMIQLKDASKQLLRYSFAWDESTDLQDTSQLLVFIRGMKANFQLTEELPSVESLKDRTIGKDLFRAVQNCIAGTVLEWK